MPNKCEVHLKHKSILTTISVFEDRLLMLHTDFMSEQFPMNNIGINVSPRPESTKLEIMHNDTETHQSLYFTKDSEESLMRFFILHGFPMPGY
jgi:hypothetical protein